MTLMELQRRMSEDVRRPLTADFEMQLTTDDGRSTSEIASGYIKPNPQLTSFERVEIYNRQYWFRVIGAVSEDYPALNSVLGAKRFDALILAYLRENPSTSFTLRDLGGRLPNWLAKHPELAGARPSLAVDIARLEWAYVEAFDGATRLPLSESDFAKLLPTSTLALQPHLRLLEVSYPVDEAVLLIRKGAPEVEMVSNAVAQRKKTARIVLPKMTKSTIYLAVHRFDNLVYYRRIDREAFILLTAIRDGHSIATVIDKAFAESNLQPREQAEKTRDYFAHASELGWLTTPQDSDETSKQSVE